MSQTSTKVPQAPGARSNRSTLVAITAAIIAMAHTLNMRVIAEGMETQDQLAFLRSRQCDAIQGNMFSQPLPAEGMTKLLQKAHLSGASASSMNE